MVPRNGWFIRENPIKIEDLGGKTPIFGNTHIRLQPTRNFWGNVPFTPHSRDEKNLLACQAACLPGPQRSKKELTVVGK